MFRFVKTLLYGKKRVEDFKENRNVAKMSYNESLKNSLRLSESTNSQTDFLRSIHHSLLKVQKDNLVDQKYADCFEINRGIRVILQTPILYSIFSNKNETFESNKQVNKAEFYKIDEESFEKKIAFIENELILDWSSLNENELSQIKFICQNWQKTINEAFPKPDNMKAIIWPEETIDSNLFDFSKHINDLKRIRWEMFSCSSNDFQYKPNTRLLMRISTQFINALTIFIEIQKFKNGSSLKSYFSSLSKALSCLKNAVFLSLFYVHYDSKMFTAFDLISYPPIYLLETNENFKDDFPTLSIETLSSYCEFCSHRFDKLETKQSEPKYNRYKLILQSLSRLIQVCFLIRESSIFKQISYNVDVLCYFVYQEVNLISRNLKELNK